MERQEAKDYVGDLVTQAVNSSNSAFSGVLRGIQIDMKTHREDELVSRELYRSELLAAVEKQIEKTVNGKIKNLQSTLDSHIHRVEPMLGSYEDNQTTKKVISGSMGNVVKVGAWSAALYGMYQLIKTVF